jgi:hypothetical protein
MKKIVHVAALLTIAAVFTRCATLSVDKARLSSIKKVAIAGFLVVQQMPEGPKWILGGSKSGGGMMEGWGSSLPSPSEHSNDMYARLAKVLKKDLKWNVIDRKAIEASTVYQAHYENYMKGLQSRPPITAKMKAFGANGVLDPYPIEQRLSDGDRKKLMKALGVDALAMATVRIQLKETGGLKNLIGAGDLTPYAEVRFAVYDTKGSEPVWSDLQAMGEAASEGAEHVFGITNMKALLDQSVAAAENSYEKLLARYRDHQG